MCLIHRKTKKRKTVSYPKYLVEAKIGRLLRNTEEIHHKDENFRNNLISNLEIKTRATHRKAHAKYKIEIEVQCGMCRKFFNVTPKQQSNKNQNRHRNSKLYFCSRQCSGYFGRIQQIKRSSRGEIGSTQRS